MIVKQIEAKLASLQVGEPQMIKHGSKEVLSGIFKQASEEARFVGTLGVQGDGQGDTIHHGGPDKAVCAYFEARYPYWTTLMGKPMTNGAFGENFTLSEWTEEDVCIGDILTVGETTLQVSQPRQPCFKLGLRNDWPMLPALAQETGYTGFYFRVLVEGFVKQGDAVKLEERHPSRLTLAEANRVMYIEKENIKEIERLLSVRELAESWQSQLEKRLMKLRS
ncbi:MOSC domain-containing protein [Paenibacillus sp. GCM10027627]|uniref:MOSC domain-containing protein n=1 Tax=unclassified Paenibacillus TaxID=185978 RepID=UPI00362E1CC3